MTSLRGRLTLWFSLAVTLTTGTALGIGYFVVQRQMYDGIDFLLAAEIEEIVQRLGRQPERLSTTEVVQALSGHTEIDAPIYFFQVRRDGHGIIFRSRNLGDAVLPELVDNEAPVRTIQLHDEPVRERVRRLGSFRIQVATNLEQVEQLIERYQKLALVGLPLLFGASLAVGFLLSAVVLVPVRAMQRSAQRISASNLSERLPVPAGSDEIAALARLLNELFARLEAAFEQVRRFTADASHEIKTPLSLIRLHAEKLALSPRLDAADRSQVEGQVEEITRLNKLVESLLFLAKADAGGLPLDLRSHDTAQFVADFAEDASVLAEDGGLVFRVTRSDSIVATFDAIMIRQVLLNILANAIRHTPAGRAVTIESRRTPEDWQLAIEDEGPGVPPQDLEKIFGRFVRGPEADQREPGGSGLGLSIARSIVEAHGGSIVADNRRGGGLRVTLHLPVDAGHGTRVIARK